MGLQSCTPAKSQQHYAPPSQLAAKSFRRTEQTVSQHRSVLFRASHGCSQSRSQSVSGQPPAPLSSQLTRAAPPRDPQGQVCELRRRGLDQRRPSQNQATGPPPSPPASHRSTCAAQCWLCTRHSGRERGGRGGGGARRGAQRRCFPERVRTYLGIICACRWGPVSPIRMVYTRSAPVASSSFFSTWRTAKVNEAHSSSVKSVGPWTWRCE